MRQCVLKMADGLCSGEQGDDVNENKAKKECFVGQTMDRGAVELVREKVTVTTPFYMARSASDQLFGEDQVSKIVDDGGFCEEDCRKKRCVDRYDSSESSDRFVSYLFVRSHRSLARPLPCYILLLLKLRVHSFFHHFLREFLTYIFYYTTTDHLLYLYHVSTTSSAAIYSVFTTRRLEDAASFVVTS